jgi:uncharacterized protein DUF2341
MLIIHRGDMKKYIILLFILITFSLFGASGDYTYYKSHVINSSIGAGTDYQVKIICHYAGGSDSGNEVYLNSNTQADFDDVDFYDNDQATQLDSWLEVKVNSDYAEFWVEVADDLGSGAQTIYIYYGDVVGTSQSDGEATFLFFDDFDDASIDLAKWDTTGSPTEAGGLLSLTDDDGVLTDDTWAINKAMRCYAECDEQDWGIGIADQNVVTPANNVMIQNSDYDYPNDFDRYKCVTGAAASGTATYSDGHEDFRSQFWTYEVTWVSGSAKFYQNEVELDEITTDVPSASLGEHLYVWDSSQECQLDVDWTLLRKFIAAEPSHGAWGNQVPPHSIPVDHIDGFEIDGDIDFIQ